MQISAEMIDEVEATLKQFTQLTNNPLPILKDCFPGLTFVRMSAADMDETPFRSLPHYDLYLLDGREHCVQLTDEPSHATSIVIAQK